MLQAHSGRDQQQISVRVCWQGTGLHHNWLFPGELSIPSAPDALKC